MFRLTLACAIVACAAAIPAGPPAPYHAPAPGYVEPVAPPVYAYEYAVNSYNYIVKNASKKLRRSYQAWS